MPGAPLFAKQSMGGFEKHWLWQWESSRVLKPRKCLNLLTVHPQFGRIWEQNFASGRSNSPTLSTASR